MRRKLETFTEGVSLDSVGSCRHPGWGRRHRPHEVVPDEGAGQVCCQNLGRHGSRE
jgi:hypothetical protein